MAEIALGWFGWTEEQALASDVNAIAVAYEGRLDMFETIGFIKREKAAQVSARPMSPELFDAVFG
ncbi:MAG: hypothetical protein ABS35_42015 [Kaistia sp. SCN 65-12]|nr:MAG: hypothetical protein ABS35_42015 [Kaistia sp. SCN 65-12]